MVLKKKKNLFSFLILLVMILFLDFSANDNFFKKVNAQEEEECDPKTVRVMSINEDGDYIPCDFNVYRQIEDVDGNPKPGSKVKSGTVSEILGWAEVEFDDEDGYRYATELIAPKSEESFWIYDDLEVGCGGEDRTTGCLSGIHFILRDMDGDLVRDKDFNVYTQERDADYKPVREKDRHIGEFNTSQTGETTIYVPSDADSIDPAGNDKYVLEIERESGGYYTKYSIDVDKCETTQVEYFLSDMKLTFKDYLGNTFPGGTQVEIFKQVNDPGEARSLGERIGRVQTNDQGRVVFAYPEGTYAARVEGYEGQTQTFWGLQIENQDRSSYTLKTDSSWTSENMACEAESQLEILVKNLDREPIPDMEYQFYEQTTNASGYPTAGEEVLDGRIGETGRLVKVFNPDPLKKYALKIYQENEEVGEFWYYNIDFECGEDKTLRKYLPAVNFVLRDGDGSLLRDKDFSVYTQKIDVDGNPVKEREDLVAKLKTSEKGLVTLYLAPDHPFNDHKKGIYVFVSEMNGKEYVAYDIKVNSEKDVDFEYTFSDLVIKLKDARDNELTEKDFEVYNQEFNFQGQKSLGEEVFSSQTDSAGESVFDYPAGTYAIKIEDDLGKDYIFWDARIKDRERSYKKINTNLTRVKMSSASDARVNIYELKEDTSSIYYKGDRLGRESIASPGFTDLILKPNPYLFVVEGEEDKEFGKAIYIQTGQFQEVVIGLNNNYLLQAGQRFHLTKPEPPQTLADRLRGNILLQVEDNGEAWYVNPEDKRRYYMKNGEVAYEMMRSFGLGITNEDLKKIPIGFDNRFNEEDTDGDNLPDKMEEALETDIRQVDSDGDGYDDDVEIRNGYNPAGPGKLPWDSGYAEKLKGKILLQVEERGQAWYVNPEDGKRYYMKDGASAYEIMRFLSLGITNDNLSQIPEGTINK